MSKVTRSVILSIAGVLAVFAVVFLLFVYSGAYNVAATQPHTAFGNWMLGTVMETSVRERAPKVGPVPDLTDSARVQNGFTHYQEMCVVCHGAPGVDRGEIGKGLVPEPPLLHEEVGEWSDRELFWIVKHGIKMSGMPAWGVTHSDEEIWGMVAFMRRLPQLSAEEYREMVRAAGLEGAGPGHGHDGGHEHGGGEEEGGAQGAEEGHTHPPGEGHEHDE